MVENTKEDNETFEEDGLVDVLYKITYPEGTCSLMHTSTEFKSI